MDNFQKLSRAEMKNLYGGKTAPGSCTATCADKTTVTCSGSNCLASDADKNGNGYCSGGGTSKSC